MQGSGFGVQGLRDQTILPESMRSCFPRFPCNPLINNNQGTLFLILSFSLRDPEIEKGKRGYTGIPSF